MEQQVRTTPQTEHGHGDALGAAVFVLAVIALALAPTQLTIPVKGIPMHPAELVMLPAALLWAIRWVRVRDTHHLPPATHWLVVLAVALGVFALGDALKLSVVKDTAQMAFYLLVAVTVFRAVFTTPARVRTAMIALLATTTLAVALAVVQWSMLPGQYQPDPQLRAVHDSFSWRVYVMPELPTHVSSTFATWSQHGVHMSRTAYAGFLALVLPFALAAFVSVRRHPGIVIWIGLLFAAAGVSVLAGYVVPAILFGLLVTGYALGPRGWLWTLGGVAAYLLLTAVLGGFNRTEVLVEPFHRKISTVEARYRYDDGTRHLKKFWGEQQAALNVIRRYPLLGVGSGGYQARVGQSFDRLGLVDEQRLESDAQNGYLLWTVNTGILGLATLLLLYAGALGRVRAAVRGSRGTHPWAAAALGALVALIIMTLVTNPWVRGTSMLVAALLALSYNVATFAPAMRIKGQEGNPCDDSR